MVDKLSKDNRRDVRIAVSRGIWVAWKAGGPRIVSRVRDLSAGGVFVSARDPVTVGTSIEMLFSLPEGEIRVQGIVRFSADDRGFGVEFTSMGAADRARLLDLLRRLNVAVK
ncbi:MAG: PilZ domain-containing protein [Acidobacteriota bacterium]|nr:PilZ domain-containing protein [Acidobacteriota bacterium]MDE3169331.1 PilZ domain-containing protein [Acidobacteriota bacterium]